MLPAESSFRKCTPSTIVSQVSTISWPSGGRSTAASSRSDSADTSVASGAKWRAMMSNSPMPFSPAWPPSSTIARPVGGELARPRLMAELVQDAIHHLRLVVAEKRMGNVDIFGDDHADGHIVARQDLISAGAQDGAEDRIDAREPPPCGELLIDQRIDLELLAHHALDEVAKEGGL